MITVYTKQVNKGIVISKLYGLWTSKRTVKV